MAQDKVKLRAPAKMAALSVDGVEYRVQKGALEVSPEHVDGAVEHGCVLEQPASE